MAHPVAADGPQLGAKFFMSIGRACLVFHNIHCSGYSLARKPLRLLLKNLSATKKAASRRCTTARPSESHAVLVF